MSLPASPAGALKMSHSEKSEPLQKPHCPVSRYPPGTRAAVALGFRFVLPARVANVSVPQISSCTCSG